MKTYIKKFGSFSLLLAGALILVSCSTPAIRLLPPPPEEPASPAEFKFIKRTKKEPPYRNYHFEVTITNPHDKPTWYVMSYYADSPVPEDGTFFPYSERKMPFVSERLMGEKAGGEGQGQATKVLFDGKEGSKFFAFLLAPSSAIHLQRVTQAAKLPFENFELCEAKGIFVNSRTALEDWLPYGIMSDPFAVIPKDAPAFRLDHNRRGTKQRTDYPDEPVQYVWVDVVHRWAGKIDFGN